MMRAKLQEAITEANTVRLPSSRIAALTKARQRQERAEQEQLRELALDVGDLHTAIAAPLELDALIEDDQVIEIEAPTPDLELRHRINSMLGLLYPRERVRQIEMGALERLRR